MNTMELRAGRRMIVTSGRALRREELREHVSGVLIAAGV